jgi:hypothetical protein
MNFYFFHLVNFYEDDMLPFLPRSTYNTHLAAGDIEDGQLAEHHPVPQGHEHLHIQPYVQYVHNRVMAWNKTE